ncbi:TraR/DksA family transcriptional regulator [Actinomadura violacea]|uniref:TraR/DksA C4-type zinc finger protein n=1 Tax=Actinomadura violacea TaxID=2819934 RepID=A0ABS3S035_9ACTN|nr:TraR/DksA C4-type zinc finger protein [Actinomadura violacea]MBO2462367.1 TraR/DksA C4-type zinc finger protein [Actinomadura violacea]
MTTSVDDGAAGRHALGDAAAREMKQRLEDERRRRASQLGVLEQSVGQVSVEQTEASDYARMENLRESLTEIGSALQRLEDGTYGRCEGCAQPIPAGRLEILPYVRFCVKCQGKKNRTTR